jgi:hypothetical protein
MALCWALGSVQQINRKEAGRVEGPRLVVADTYNVFETLFNVHLASYDPSKGYA